MITAFVIFTIVLGVSDLYMNNAEWRSDVQRFIAGIKE